MEHLKLSKHKAEDLARLFAVDPLSAERYIPEIDFDRFLIAKQPYDNRPCILRVCRVSRLFAGRAPAEQLSDIELIELPVILLLFLMIIVEDARVGAPPFFHSISCRLILSVFPD